MSKTLLVDGNNLLKIGIHGVKDFFNNGVHVGGIWHFINTLRKFLEENNYNKIVVQRDVRFTPNINLIGNKRVKVIKTLNIPLHVRKTG